MLLLDINVKPNMRSLIAPLDLTWGDLERVELRRLERRAPERSVDAPCIEENEMNHNYNFNAYSSVLHMSLGQSAMHVCMYVHVIPRYTVPGTTQWGFLTFLSNKEASKLR